MGYFQEVRCIRCGRPLGENDRYYEGCPDCHQAGVNSNWTTVYDVTGAKLPGQNGEPGIYRFRDFYPIAPDVAPVSIGEGNTPLLKLERLGREMGLSNLYAKDETRNPTLSFKDRLCSLVATMARQQKAPAITISSTGNHGAAMAAYAAAAEIPCIVFTVPYVPDCIKTLMQVYGAYVMVCPTAQDRWTIMGQCVRELGWMPASGFQSPPIGSNCYAIDGYKSIAFEVYEQLGGEAPAFFAAPTAYCDGLYGIYKGMNDLKDMGYISALPRMVAGESCGTIEETLRRNEKAPVKVEGSTQVAFSVGTTLTTFQGLEAVWKTDGYARSSTDEEVVAMQKRLASREGIYAENSSVLSLLALEKLAKEGIIKPDDKVVALITSTGMRDPETTAQYLPKPPVIQPTMADLRAALKNSYGYSL